MTAQRYSDIENAILVGLLEAPEHNEDPFSVNSEIFTTPFKRKVAKTINAYIENNEAYLARFKLENAVDLDVKMQDYWIEMQEKTSEILPVSMLKKYYDDLVFEYKEKLFGGAI